MYTHFPRPFTSILVCQVIETKLSLKLDSIDSPALYEYEIPDISDQEKLKYIAGILFWYRIQLNPYSDNLQSNIINNTQFIINQGISPFDN